jgi:hypothetical protein
VRTLPEVDQSYQGLYKILIASIRLKLLSMGIEMKAFNVLSNPKPPKDIAEAIGTHPSNTRLFLDGSVAMGFPQKKNCLYRNLPGAQAFLVEDSPTY